MPRKVKAENCVGCNISFQEERYYCKDYCYKCYYKQYYGAVNKSTDFCVSCNLQFGTLNKKGRPVFKITSTLCRSCYHKKNQEVVKCQKCDMFISGTKTYCAMCSIELGLSYKKKWRPKKKNDNVGLTKIQFEFIRRLFGRFKIGSQDYVDYFRVADIYVDVYGLDVIFDGYKTEVQVVMMLRRLKKTWDFNKPIFEKR